MDKLREVYLNLKDLTYTYNTSSPYHINFTSPLFKQGTGTQRYILSGGYYYTGLLPYTNLECCFRVLLQSPLPFCTLYLKFKNQTQIKTQFNRIITGVNKIPLEGSGSFYLGGRLFEIVAFYQGTYYPIVNYETIIIDNQFRGEYSSIGYLMKSNIVKKSSDVMLLPISSK